MNTSTAAQSRTTRSPWAVRRAAAILFVTMATLVTLYAPLTMTLGRMDIGSLLIGAVLALATWASFMLLWFTYRKV